MSDQARDPAGATKTLARGAVRARRRARPQDERDAAAQGVARVVLEHLAAARVVAAYVSTPTEPGTAPLRRALAARGVRVLLPVVTGGPLAWVIDGADDEGGRPAPTLALADVVLLPALAVTPAGQRLGQGGGHYDRTLAGLRPGTRPLLVALVHDDEVLDGLPGRVLGRAAWPLEAHDVRVDAVATPSRWLETAGTTGAAGTALTGTPHDPPRRAPAP